VDIRFGIQERGKGKRRVRYKLKTHQKNWEEQKGRGCNMGRGIRKRKKMKRYIQSRCVRRYRKSAWSGSFVSSSSSQGVEWTSLPFLLLLGQGRVG